MYFTIRTNHAGLADQLSQVDHLHTLGTALGYRYLHTPLTDSSHGFRGKRLDDFLGLGIGELDWDPSASHHYRVVDVDVAEILPAEPVTCDVDAIRQTVTAVYGESPNTVYRFCYEWRHCDPLNQTVRTLLSQFPFASKYWQRRGKSPILSPFGEARVKIAVHIRKGDVARMVYKGRPVFKGSYVEEHGTPYPHVPVSLYRSVIEQLVDTFSPEATSVFIFSDGYQETFRMLSRLAVSSTDREELISLKEHHDRELMALEGLPGVRLLIGEDEEGMLSAIHACAACDILIRNVGGFAWSCFRYFNRGAHAKMFTLPGEQTQIPTYYRKLLMSLRDGPVVQSANTDIAPQPAANPGEIHP